MHFFNGEDFLDHLTDHSASGIGLVLLDLNMPKVGGLEVLQFMKERRLDIPTVIFTTSELPSDIKEGYELGANAYVNKPININEYEYTMLSIISFWCGVKVAA